MLEKLRFSIGNERHGYKTICLSLSADHVTCEIIHTGLLSINKGIYEKTVTADWLGTWTALAVSRWDKAYKNVTIGNSEGWQLSVWENGTIFTSCGFGTYPTQWTAFIEWLDALVPEMDFAASNQRVQYIYCKVRFGKSTRLYSYRTDDTNLEIGDVVKVPVGDGEDIGYATIEEISYFNEDNVPYPIEKTRKIIGLHHKRGE